MNTRPTAAISRQKSLQHLTCIKLRIKENDWRPEETNFRGPVLWMCLSRKVAFIKRIDCTYRSYHRVRTESWILKKVLKFVQLFSRPGKSLEEMKSGKNDKKSWVFFFPNLQQVLYKGIFFVFFVSNLIQPLPYVCSVPRKKAWFLRFKASIDHLFDNLESGGRNYCFGKSSGKSLAFSIQKSVWTLLPALCVTSFFRCFFFPSH